MKTTDLVAIKWKYSPRIIDHHIEHLLEISDAILLKGPKWCGKSWTGAFFSNSVLDFQDIEDGKKNIELVNSAPAIAISTPKPLLIDEWQDAEIIWDIVRKKVDMGLNDKFILTGSVTPSSIKNFKSSNTEQKKHSGSGRIIQVQMYPMTFYEKHKTEISISISELLNGKQLENGLLSKLTVYDIANEIVQGGWPKTRNLDSSDAQILVGGYINAIADDDTLKYRNIRINAKLVNKLLFSWTRNISTYSSYETIYKDVIGILIKPISLPTFKSYISVLKDMYLIDEIEPWSPNVRSKTRVRGTTKKILIDPSIGCASNNITAQKLVGDLNYLGFFFENLVIRDLKAFSEVTNWKILQYRDNSGLEVDAILELGNDEYAAVEIKLSNFHKQEAVENLKRFYKKMEKTYKAPKLMIVIVGIGSFTEVIDGVHVIPYEFLKN